METSNEKKILILNSNEILPNRYQPRKKFSEDELLELTESIKKYGILEPIIVRPLGDKYELVAGERRYKANVLAGNDTIPTIVKDLNDAECSEIAIIENLQRKDLSPLEEALSYKRAIDMGYATQQQLAEKIGKSQSYIANKIRLLKLSDEVQDALLNGKISERHARSLLRLNELKQQNDMLNKIIKERLTVRKTDEEIDKMNSNYNVDSLETTPISTIFENNKVNKTEVDENDLFKFGPDLSDNFNSSSNSSLMSFDMNGDLIANNINSDTNNVEMRGNEDKMIQSDDQNNSMKITSDNAQPIGIPNFPKMPDSLEQAEPFSMFNNGTNSVDSNMNEQETSAMFNNNDQSIGISGFPTMQNSLEQAEPFPMFNNSTNSVDSNMNEQGTSTMFNSNAQPIETQGFGLSSNLVEQNEPFSMFNSSVNPVDSNINEQVTSTMVNSNEQPIEMPGFGPLSNSLEQAEPFSMFNSSVNPVDSNMNEQETSTMFNNNVQSIEMPNFDMNSNKSTNIMENNQVESLRTVNNGTNTAILNKDNMMNSDLTNPMYNLDNGITEKNLSQDSNDNTHTQKSINASEIPSTPIFENNQFGDSISEFKKPEPIIVADYSKQYDPVMPQQNDKKPDIDFKTIINLIRQCSDTIEKCGYKIDTEEYDLENIYQVVFKIDKL